MILKTIIIKSNFDDYIENKIKKINVNEIIGEGSYGVVLLLQNEHVIKIFKNSTLNNTILDESNYLIPIKNENRELIFFFKYIVNNNINNNLIINVYAIGIIKDKIIINNTIYDENSYFIILPYYIPFYKKFEILNKPLIDKSNGLLFTLKVMKRMLDASNYLENEFNIINLDIKLNNCMVPKKEDNINNILMIDFSIYKKKTNKKYNILNKYYLWPDGNINIEYIPSYSISISGLQLLFGHDEIIKFKQNYNKQNNKEFDDNKFIKYLKIIKDKNKNIYNIFNDGLINKSNTINLLNNLNNLLNNFSTS
jgi:hypothetical protein